MSDHSPGVAPTFSCNLLFYSISEWHVDKTSQWEAAQPKKSNLTQPGGSQLTKEKQINRKSYCFHVWERRSTHVDSNVSHIWPIAASMCTSRPIRTLVNIPSSRPATQIPHQDLHHTFNCNSKNILQICQSSKTSQDRPKLAKSAEIKSTKFN